MFLKIKNITKNKFKAFTIIELSVVFFIVSILIVGVSSTKLMIRKSRLANAQSLTQRSIINDLSSDLVLWYETSLQSSFLTTEIKNDASSISTWRDNNINAVDKNNATNSTQANQPTYYQNVFYDSIPGVRFDGASDYLDIKCNKIVNSAYTIFVVEQRTSSKSMNYFIAGSELLTNGTPHLGYRAGNTITQAHYSNDFDITITAYSKPEPRIHTFKFNSSVGKQYTLNGKSTYTNSPVQSQPLTSCNQVAIGRYATSNYYQGDLAEIIMFKRSLKTEEVEAIENYLGSKYGISVS